MSDRLHEAYQACLAIASRHAENFPTASRLLAPRLRPAVAAIYAFARLADDLADEGELPPAERRKRLDAWEELLLRCAREELDHPVFLALGDAIRRFAIPVELLQDLLVAFRMDTEVSAYATEQELRFYCRHSAMPVGRLLLHLHGALEPRWAAASDALCTALQLTNFWQDFAADLARGRCYLPANWLARAGLAPEDLLGGRWDEEALRPAWDAAFVFTERLYAEAEPLLSVRPLRLRLQAAASLAGGRRVLAKVRRRRRAAERPVLEGRDRLGMALFALRAALR